MVGATFLLASGSAGGGEWRAMGSGEQRGVVASVAKHGQRRGQVCGQAYISDVSSTGGTAQLGKLSGGYSEQGCLLYSIPVWLGTGPTGHGSIRLS